MTRSQQTHECEFANTVQNTDSSCKTVTKKETGKVTDMNKISVDSIDDNKIKDNKEAVKDKEIEILSVDIQAANNINEKKTKLRISMMYPRP